MCLARQIDQFFRTTGQNVFIEAEAKRGTMLGFLNEYNQRRNENLSLEAGAQNGVVTLEENANKWGLELRCYFTNCTGFPEGIHITDNPVYKPGYQFRFNDVDVIKSLIYDFGYKIGFNG